MQTTSDQSLVAATTSIRPLSAGELDRLRAYGRQDRSFDALARQAVRFRVLSVTGCIPDDVDARRGAERAEVAALFGLALRPTASTGEARMQEALFAAVSEGRDDNVSAMLAASLAADLARLEALSARRRASGSRGLGADRW